MIFLDFSEFGTQIKGERNIVSIHKIHKNNNKQLNVK